MSEKSGAWDAGIEPGEVILEADGNKVTTAPELQEVVARHRPGDRMKLKINRDGKEKDVKVTLKNRDGDVRVVANEKKEILNVLGAEFETVDEKTAKQLDIEGGVKVKKLFTGKLTKHTDLREGFIITKVNSKVVMNKDELVKVLEEQKGGVMLEGVYENIPGVYYYAFGI